MMVSKESGRAGGFLEKYQAAKETGCRMIVIGRPKEEQGMELEKCIEYLDRRFLSKENVANDAKIESVNTDTENIENIEKYRESWQRAGKGCAGTCHAGSSNAKYRSGNRRRGN